ncbi:MAG: hypothetical protein ACR2HP_07015 [Ilumatobacteraceae bacterium]
MNEQLRQVASLTNEQHGAITAAQMRAAGMTDAERRRRVRSGVLVRAGSHTFRSPFAPSSMLSELAAAVLDCGQGAAASGPSAAALHGFDGFRLRRPLHVMVPRGRNVQRAHLLVHTTSELPLIDRATVEGVTTLSATRTVIDLARFVLPGDLTMALGSALRDGLTSEDLLHRRIASLRSSGRYGIPQLLAVIEGCEITRGGHSWLERRFLELCASAGLPRPLTQQVLSKAQDRIVRVDCRFPGSPVIIELMGYRWHRTVDQMSRDAARFNTLVLDGFVPLQFTHHHVTLEPEWVLTQVTAALTRLAA